MIDRTGKARGGSNITDKVNIKSHKIMAMEPEKRDRVINAAMKGFSSGFKNASTDVIVRNAGISKGLLFHYFGTKEKLFEFILWYSFDIMKTEYFGLMNFDQRDILERIWQMVLLKMDLSYKYPALFDFIAAAYSAGKDDPADEFTKYFKTKQADMLSKMFEDIDTTLFKDGIEPDRAINIIWWSMAGYSDAQVDTDKSIADYQKEYARYLSDLKEYFDILKKVFYK